MGGLVVQRIAAKVEKRVRSTGLLGPRSTRPFNRGAPQQKLPYDSVKDFAGFSRIAVYYARSLANATALEYILRSKCRRKFQFLAACCT